MLSCQSRISSWRKITRRPSSVRAVMWTGDSSRSSALDSSPELSGALALGSVRLAASRFRALRDIAAISARFTSISSTVTTVPLKSCFSHCVAPMRRRSPTAISSGSVLRPSRSRLTSITARFASGVWASTRSRISHDSARVSARVRASTTVEVSGSSRTWRSQSSTSLAIVFSSSWQRWRRPRRCHASMAFSASPSLSASETATCHGVNTGLRSIAS